MDSCPLCKERLARGARRCPACGAELRGVRDGAGNQQPERLQTSESLAEAHAEVVDREQRWRGGKNTAHVIEALRSLVVNHTAGRDLREDLEAVRVYYALATEERRKPIREAEPLLVLRALEILIDSRVRIHPERRSRKTAAPVPARKLLPSGEHD